MTPLLPVIEFEQTQFNKMDHSPLFFCEGQMHLMQCRRILESSSINSPHLTQLDRLSNQVVFR